MALFNIENNNKLERIKEQSFKLEREIQNLTEQNLKTIFGLILSQKVCKRVKIFIFALKKRDFL